MAKICPPKKLFFNEKFRFTSFKHYHACLEEVDGYYRGEKGFQV
jgi:hypothetical protein